MPADTPSIRTIRATRYVTPLREGGSLPGLVEADDDGLYVVKFHGAAQGPRALVAELIAGELGRALGLPVPEIVAIEVDPALADAEPDPWVKRLLAATPSLDLGMDFLPGALPYARATGPRPEPGLAADVVWFDSLVTNSDRSPRNPNLVVWHRRPWLIDHGASLFIHHTWTGLEAHARRPLPTIADHVLLPDAGPVTAAHERLAPAVTEPLLRAIVALVPDAWLASESPVGGPDGQRDAYVRYLLARLAASEMLARAIDEVPRAA